MTSQEFRDWQLYAIIEPFGGTRDDARAGTIAAMIANVNRKRGAKPLTELDFFPPYERRNKTQTVEDQISIAVMLNEAFGGVDLRDQKTATIA